MAVKWKKLGRVFEPKGQYPWCVTHAMLPTPMHLHDDIYRIYFSGRNKDNQSLIGYVEIDLNDPTKVLTLSEKPVLGLGELGTFDDNGVTPTHILIRGPDVLLYYMGWNKGSTTRAAEMTGLAISYSEGLTFKRVSRAPILKRTNQEPFSILVLSDIVGLDMYYDSADKWINSETPQYNIKYGCMTVRRNFTDFQTFNTSCIKMNPGETRISRASVIKSHGRFEMWYCYAYRLEGYNMGYATSEKGAYFNRHDDKVGIEKSKEGWDSEMLCYPKVFKHKQKLYMLYNGNNYGKTGFGIAIEDGRF